MNGAAQLIEHIESLRRLQLLGSIGLAEMAVSVYLLYRLSEESGWLSMSTAIQSCGRYLLLFVVYLPFVHFSQFANICVSPAL